MGSMPSSQESGPFSRVADKPDRVSHGDTPGEVVSTVFSCWSLRIDMRLQQTSSVRVSEQQDGLVVGVMLAEGFDSRPHRNKGRH